MGNKTNFICNVGTNDYKGSTSVNGKRIKSYQTWMNMLERCYSVKQQIKRPTYVECYVCDEWLSFSNFKVWFDNNYVEGFHLDKDILVEGNKVYSPEFCRFVPVYLNSLLTDHRNARGEFPVGVSERKPDTKTGKVNSTYLAQCSNGYGKNISKTFKTIQEASIWYADTKKAIVKEQAQRAFLENAIKTDVYLALVRRNWYNTNNESSQQVAPEHLAIKSEVAPQN